MIESIFLLILMLLQLWEYCLCRLRLQLLQPIVLFKQRCNRRIAVLPRWRRQ